MDQKEALRHLCTCTAPSGFETPAAQAAVELLSPLMEEVSIDRMGNVVGVRRCGKPDAKRLLLDAHLDEIGLIVTGIENGFLRFRSIGGVDPRMLPNRELTLLTDPPIYGVVACLPPHVQAKEDTKKSIPIRDLYIDVGFTQEEAVKKIPIGTPAVFRAGCFSLGERQICGKSLDDRSGFVILLRTAELLSDTSLDVDLYILGSTREETNGSGAKTGAFALKPDYCIAVDVTHGWTPDAPKCKKLLLEEGPAIGVGPNMTRWMTDRMIAKAKEQKIPYQIEVMSGHTGTNGWYLQVSREGVATSVLSLPLKYMHSPIESVALSDIEQTAQLLAAFIQGLGEEAGGLC